MVRGVFMEKGTFKFKVLLLIFFVKINEIIFFKNAWFEFFLVKIFFK